MGLSKFLIVGLLTLNCAVHAEPLQCLRTLDLKPNEHATIAATVLDEWVAYGSQSVLVKGEVRTDDGANHLRSVWLTISDLFRWGKNEDLDGSRGPIIEFDERVGFWGKGMAEIRVEAIGSPTHLCLCTLDQVASSDTGYPRRVAQCMDGLKRPGAASKS